MTGRQRPKGGPRAGFNLITLCVLVVVASMMLVASLPGQRAGNTIMKAADTTTKLAVVEQKMVNFMAKNGRRPCPASGQYDVNSSYFGIEAANPGSCTGGTPAAPLVGNATATATITGATQGNPVTITAANSFSNGDVIYISGVGGMTQLMGYYMVANAGANSFTLTDTSGNAINSTGYATYTSGGTATRAGAVAGTIPTKTLGLDDSYAFDQWGRRITYTVDTRATNNGTCTAMEGLTSTSTTPNPTAAGGIVIRNGTSGSAIDQTMYAYISHGPDGHGAWPAQGSTVANRINTGSTDADEQTNANVNSSFGTNFTNIKVQKVPTSTFGDILYYTDYLKNTCCVGGPPYCPAYGLRIDGTIASQAVSIMASADLNGDGIPDLILSGTDNSKGGGVIYVIFGQSGGITPNPFLLPTNLNGSNGFQITHPCYGQGAPGIAIGDFDGDGLKDLAIGWGGRLSILFGRTSYASSGGTINLCTLNTTTSPKMVSMSIGYDPYSNPNVSGFKAADVNGDGISDLVMYDTTGPGASPSAFRNGDVYVMFGNASIASTYPASFTSFVSGITGANSSSSLSNGIHIEGVNQNDFGAYVGFGDFNGDGIQDMLIAENYSASGYYYAVWGHPASYTYPNNGVITMSMASLPSDGSIAVQFNNAGGPLTGLTDVEPSLSQAADLNGDGIDDIQLNGFNTSCGNSNYNGAGGIFTIFGMKPWPSSSTFDVSTLNGTNGTVFMGNWGYHGGTNNEAYVGFQPYIPVDISGDGKKDMITTAGWSRTDLAVVFGPGSGSWTNPLSDNNPSLNGTNGFELKASGANTTATWLTASGDVNGDGVTDLLFGDYSASSGAGQVFVVKGGAGDYNNGYIDATSIGTYGWLFQGANAGDKAGSAVTTADLNNDGVPDPIISAPGASPSGVSGAGSVYVIWGRKSGWPTPLSLSGIQ